MRAAFNTTMSFYRGPGSVNPGELYAGPFPCRLVLNPIHHFIVFPFSLCTAYVTYLVNDPRWNDFNLLPAGELEADYSVNTHLAIPHTGPPNWAALLVEEMHPILSLFYRRVHVAPLPFPTW